MDNNEATSTVMSRIQRLDPENACKIMGYILLQDPGEKEMIRLAFGPENQLISLTNQAKSYLGLSSNTSSAPSTPSSPSPFNHISNPLRPNPFPQSSPRIIIPNNNGFHMSPSSPSSPWFPNTSHMSPKPASSLSYAAVVNGTHSNSSQPFSSPPNPPFSPPFYHNTDVNEDYNNIPVPDELLFLEDTKNMDFMDPIMSPSGRSDSILFPYGNCNDNHHQMLHRRSVSVSDVFLGSGQSDDNQGGFGWRPCMYYAKGFCKNGTGCKFLHGGFADSPDGSPKFDGFDELMRMKAIQQQRLAMAGGAPLPYNRCMSFLNENPRSAAAALMMGEDYHTLGRCRSDRNDFSPLGFGGNPNSSSRQIYLTFPADSTFKEEDVSNYFSTYGPVQDVRIPYQQKRMFGFVTFVYPETVKQILAKGNPHFVCDSRVLVKPYKEKGKIPDKKQHMDRGEFPACLSPSGLDSREPYDLPFRGGMVYHNQEMILRRKLEEEAEMQQAIEYQGRRLMNFQLPDLMNHDPNNQIQRHMLATVPMSSPVQGYTQVNQNLVDSLVVINQEDLEGSNSGEDEGIAPTDAADQKLPHEMNESCNYNNSNGKEASPNLEDSDFCGSLEHVLPENLFASPTKSAASHQSSLGCASAVVDTSIPITPSSDLVPLLPTTSTLNMASLEPKFSLKCQATM